MYRINLDVVNKIFYIEASGSISSEDIKSAVADLKNLIDKLDRRQYSMLFLEQGLDPFSQDSLPAIQKALELVLDWAKKIAVVSGNRKVTQMQVKRIESEARKELNISIPIMRFRSVDEALNYINH